MADDPYDALRVAHKASAAEVRAAYNAMAARFHPDNGGSDPANWQRIQRAYDTLIDRDSRDAYDAAAAGEVGEEEGWWGDDDEDDEDDEGSGDEERQPWECELEPFDLLAALELRRGDDGEIVGRETRIRACFHKLSTRLRPWPWEAYPDAAAHAEAVRDYRRVCLAFLALRDPARRNIYASCGYGALRASEAYQEASVFEPAAQARSRADFFAGVDEADREWLLMNGSDRADDGFEEERPAR